MALGDRGRGSYEVNTENVSIHKILLQIYKSAEPQRGLARKRISSLKEDNNIFMLLFSVVKFPASFTMKELQKTEQKHHTHKVFLLNKHFSLGLLLLDSVLIALKMIPPLHLITNFWGR